MNNATKITIFSQKAKKHNIIIMKGISQIDLAFRSIALLCLPGKKMKNDIINTK